ncbi:MAG: hypothetical protein FWC95_07030, partial [Defluviitaleaceae bacterium]|nr:hypothetical protein [Defluviitaleaceae bacterium]
YSPGATDILAFDPAAATANLTEIYTQMISQITTDFTWIFSAFIFVMVIVLVSAISKLSVNYSKEAAIGLGSILCIFAVILSAGVGVGELFGNAFAAVVFILLSAFLAWFLRLFDVVMDYKNSRRVEFEDEDYVYYVKMINKKKTGIGVVSNKDAKPAPKPVGVEIGAKPAKQEKLISQAKEEAKPDAPRKVLRQVPVPPPSSSMPVKRGSGSPTAQAQSATRNPESTPKRTPRPQRPVDYDYDTSDSIEEILNVGKRPKKAEPKKDEE